MPGIPIKLIKQAVSDLVPMLTGAAVIGGGLTAANAVAESIAESNGNEPYEPYYPPQNGTWTNQPYQYKSNDNVLTLAEQYNTTPQAIISANPGGYPFVTGQTVNMPTFQEIKFDATQPPASNTVKLNPAQPYGGLAPAKANNTDFAKTRTARYYAAGGTPFLQQKRYDPQTGKYVSIGRLLKQGKLDLQGNWHTKTKRQRQNEAQTAQKKRRQGKQDHTLTNSFITFGTGAG